MSRPVIGIHGAPRSGTTWLGQLFNSSERVLYRYQPFFSHAFRGRVGSTSIRSEFESFFDDLAVTRDDFVLQRGSRILSRRPVEFKKKHADRLVYKEVRFHSLIARMLEQCPGYRCIGIVRDPRAVLSSWTKAPKEFEAQWSIEKEWRWAESKNKGLEENWYGFERWKELALLLEQLKARFPNRVILMSYATLVRDTAGVVKALFTDAGIEFGSQTADFIRASTSTNDDDPYGVFRDNRTHRSSDWKLPADIASQVEAELRGGPLEKYLEHREWPGQADSP